MATMRIQHGSFRRNHGGWHTHATTKVDLDTCEVQEYFTRTFVCECGEPVHDGEKIHAAAHDAGRIIHINCKELV